MNLFQKCTAILIIAFFSFVGCAAGPVGATGSETAQLQTQQAATAAATQVALAQMLMLILIIDYIQNQEKEETTCNRVSPVAGASGDQIPPVADGPSGYAYFDVPGGREYMGYQMADGRYLTHGDIMFEAPSDVQAPSFNAADLGGGPQASVYYPHGKWASRQIHYYYDGSNPADSTMVTSAIDHWEKHSGFRFFQTTSGDSSVPKINFVTGQSGGGCWSYIGRITNAGSQYINVDNGCGVGSTVHEIGHALGLFHEQSRNDRDEHVDIDLSNVSAGARSNYDKAGSNGSHSGPYDFDSIMHYGSYYFAVDSSKTTMTKKNGDVIIPNRSTLTSCDIDGAHASNP